MWAPFLTNPVSNLRRPTVEDFITARAADHPRSAKNELEFLKRVLTEAKGRGQKVDPAVLAIPAIKHQPLGMDPASAAERLGHTDGGALFLRRYRHLYEGEKRTQADRFDAPADRRPRPSSTDRHKSRWPPGAALQGF